MTDPVLGDWQYEVGGYVFGFGTVLRVSSFDIGGKPEVRAQDVNRPLGDGVLFGQDWLAGRTLTWEGKLVPDDRDGWAAYAPLADAWAGDDVRVTPGAVTAARVKMPGRATQRVYGRPRRVAPTMDVGSGGGVIGVVPVVMDFACADHLWYGDELQSLTVGAMPTDTSAISWPALVPWLFSTTTVRPASAVAGGTVPTWPVVTVTGPVVKPAVTLPGRWTVQLDTDVAAGQTVTIDTRPWARKVTRGDGALAGDALTRRVPPLHTLTLPPGPFTVHFGGQATTEDTRCVFSWRDARRSL